MEISNQELSHSERLSRFKYEMYDILGIGLSMIVAQVFIVSTTMIVLFYAGRLSTAELDGVGLAMSLLNISGFATTAGLATACETLLSQAYGGPNLKMVGVFFQRGIVFFTLGYLIMATVNINGDIFFGLLGQDPVVACIAKRYLVLFTPGLGALFIYRIVTIYLRIQDVFWPIIFCTAFGVVVLLVAGYVAVFALEAGVDGIAHATSICFVSMTGSLVAYIIIRGLHVRTWPGWSANLFRDWWQFGKLAGAGVVLVISDYCFIEIITILSGTMGGTELAVQAIVFQVDLLADMVHFGFSIAVAIRVGTSLGGNDPKRAKRVIVQVLCCGLVASAIVAGITSTFRYQIMGVFSEDEAIIALGGDLMLVAAACMLVEGTYTILNGTFRGCGRQATASLVNIVGIYCIGVPILLSLYFTVGISLINCWWLFTGTLAILDTGFATVILRTNWEHQAQLAQERIGSRSRTTSRTAQTEYEEYALSDQDEMRESTSLLHPHRKRNPSEGYASDGEPKRWKSVEQMMGSLSRQQSALNLYLPPDNETMSTGELVRNRLVIVFVVVLVTFTLSSLNIGGVITPELLFGDRPTFVNATMVESCRHLIT